MAVISTISICISDLTKRKANFVKAKNGKVYYNATVVINDDVNDFGNNVYLAESQTEEQRKEKAPKVYLGNGKVVWTDGNVIKVDSDSKPKAKEDNSDDDFDLF